MAQPAEKPATTTTLGQFLDTMKPLHLLAYSLVLALGKPLSEAAMPSRAGSKHLRPVIEKRQQSGFSSGNPEDGKGKGGPLSGGTNHDLDLQNPDNLGKESTDAGTVVNIKWSFSDSHTRLLNGGWVREQVITDLPVSTDIASAQQHLEKGAIRELHWHRVVSSSRAAVDIANLPGGMGLRVQRTAHCVCRRRERS
jgi:hypothetical protein